MMKNNLGLSNEELELLFLMVVRNDIFNNIEVLDDDECNLLKKLRKIVVKE